MLYIPLTRAVPEAEYSPTFYLNVDQSLSFARATDDTHTRIRGTSVYTPVQVASSGLQKIDPQVTLAPGEETVIEVLVLETPQEILDLIAAASTVTVRRPVGTRAIGSPATSPMRPQ